MRKCSLQSDASQILAAHVHTYTRHVWRKLAQQSPFRLLLYIFCSGLCLSSSLTFSPIQSSPLFSPFYHLKLPTSITAEHKRRAAVRTQKDKDRMDRIG